MKTELLALSDKWIDDRPVNLHTDSWTLGYLRAKKECANQLRDALADKPDGEVTEDNPEWSRLHEAIYANLCAADNQDIPLEKYSSRILKVIEAEGFTIVLPHPATPPNPELEQAVAGTSEPVAIHMESQLPSPSWDRRGWRCVRLSARATISVYFPNRLRMRPLAWSRNMAQPSSQHWSARSDRRQ